MPDIFKLYLDQMLRHEVAQALRDEGHDVLRATEVGQARADDHQILQKAISENRVLVTLDEHFGDWVILPLKVKEKHFGYHIQTGDRDNFLSLWRLDLKRPFGLLQKIFY